jgi:hypothetical protein
MSDPVLPTELLRFSEMVLGLVRAAELKEAHEGGELWDDESRSALAVAKDLGLHGQARPTRQAVAGLILKALDLSVDQTDHGDLRLVVYPTFESRGGISYNAELRRSGMTEFHVTGCGSKAEARALIHQHIADFTGGIRDLIEEARKST